MTETVLQEEKTGCGFACVAMIAGKTYAEVKKLANEQGMYAEDEALYTTTDYVRKLLDDLGVSLGKDNQPFIGWGDLPALALLATKYRVENGTPRWHWSVYRSEPPSVLDPAAYLDINERTDFDEVNVEWFISCE